MSAAKLLPLCHCFTGSGQVSAGLVVAVSDRMAGQPTIEAVRSRQHA
jgi:hypothetical protein